MENLAAGKEKAIEELKKQVQRIKWHHRIDLGNGIITPGVDNSLKKLQRLGFPQSFAGKTVLDVGAWDGYFSFEAERRGAVRVLATDSFCWGQGGVATKEGFELARQVLCSKVEDLNIDVLELSPERIGTFDVVLFLGVLYHMRHPLLALEHVASVCKDQQTACYGLLSRWGIGQ
jgi:tRNA (mo5U34)-methyltransferase